MEIFYKLKILEPHSHLVSISMRIILKKCPNNIRFYLFESDPKNDSSRNIQEIKILKSNGEFIEYQQIGNGEWEILFDELEHHSTGNFEFFIEYKVYCFSFYPENSYIGEEIVFLRGRNIFLGIKDIKNVDNLIFPKVEIEFFGPWSKINTLLKDISKSRDVFLYEASNFSELLNAPIFIGCYDTDGFMSKYLPHEINYEINGPNDNLIESKIKKDIKKIVYIIEDYFGPQSSDRYMFFLSYCLNDFYLKGESGFSYLNLSIDQFNKKQSNIGIVKIAESYLSGYIGPFLKVSSSGNANWVVLGLVGFLSEIFAFRAGLITLKEMNLHFVEIWNNHLANSGRYIQSLEQASLNSKYFNFEEKYLNNSLNSKTKGVVLILYIHITLKINFGSSIFDFLGRLISDAELKNYKGFDNKRIYEIIEKLSSKQFREKVELLVETTEDLPLEEALNSAEVSFIWNNERPISFEVEYFKNLKNLTIKNIRPYGSGMKAGLYQGDEILKIDNEMVSSSNFLELVKKKKEHDLVKIEILRRGQKKVLEAVLEKSSPRLINFKIKNLSKFEKIFLA